MFVEVLVIHHRGTETNVTSLIEESKMKKIYLRMEFVRLFFGTER